MNIGPMTKQEAKEFKAEQPLTWKQRWQLVKALYSAMPWYKRIIAWWKMRNYRIQKTIWHENPPFPELAAEQPKFPDDVHIAKHYTDTGKVIPHEPDKSPTQ